MPGDVRAEVQLGSSSPFVLSFTCENGDDGRYHHRRQRPWNVLKPKGSGNRLLAAKATEPAKKEQ